MAGVPKKVRDRFNKTITKFQKVLKIAQDRDVNEADTVAIIQDILADVFGFQKYIEITSEYAIRNTYCDLAIKKEGKIQFLIEVKAVGLTLKENHLKQVVDYGANYGAQWVVLTNGIKWNLYRIKFEKPISSELVTSIDFLDLNSRRKEDQEKLFLISKEGLSKAAREAYYERVQNVNRFIISALITSEPILNILKRDLRKLSSGLKVEISEIEHILRNEVLKRDVIEGDDAQKSIQRIKKLSQKRHKKGAEKQPSNKSDNSNLSFSDRLLKEG